MILDMKNVQTGKTKLYMISFIWRMGTNSGYGTFNKRFKHDIPTTEEILECTKKLKEQDGYDETVIIGWYEIYDGG